jgi:hypothetical protein
VPGLPFGIPITLGGFILGWIVSILAQAEMKSSGNSKAKFVWVIILMAAGLWAIIFVVTGICMIIFWLLGGSVVGFWLTFGSWEALTDLALARVLIAPSTVMITALVTLFFY